MKAVDTTSLVLLVIGGLNWGLVGFFNYNLVDTAFGGGTALARVVYAVVGVAALWMVASMVMSMSKKA